MKLICSHKEGDVVDVYFDWENEQHLMGSARLRELHRSGRSFILEETMPETEQRVYNYNEWIVD